jgi:anti-sigma factor RsiW
MTAPPREDELLLLNAALDGELDAAGMIAIEAKLAADPALAAEYGRLVALRNAIRTKLPQPSAPDALRARAIAMARSPSRAPLASPRRAKLWDAPYRSLAASLMIGIVLGAGAYGLFVPPPVGDDVDRAVVAAFVRGRLTGQPVDVATSDRHTVKPWLAGKVAGATTVVDLKADGFPLVGGRVDVVGREPVATLVYQRREHQIALSELPTGGAPREPRRETRDGYALLEWSDNGRRFVAISDLPPAELDAFGVAFRSAAAAEREEQPKPAP